MRFLGPFVFWCIKKILMLIFVGFVYFFFFNLLGQLRWQGKTLENYWHESINRPYSQYFFARVLQPLHWGLMQLGYPAGRSEIESILASKPAPDGTPKSPLSESQLKNLKEGIRQREEALRELELQETNAVSK